MHASFKRGYLKALSPYHLFSQWENIKYQKEGFGVNEIDSTPYLATFQTSILTLNVKTYIPWLKKPSTVWMKNISMKSVFSNNHKREDCLTQCLAAHTAKAKGILAIVSTFFFSKRFYPERFLYQLQTCNIIVQPFISKEGFNL